MVYTCLYRINRWINQVTRMPPGSFRMMDLLLFDHTTMVIEYSTTTFGAYYVYIYIIFMYMDYGVFQYQISYNVGAP